MTNPVQSKTNRATESHADGRETQQFFRIASISTALCLGCATGSLESLRLDDAGISFRITVGTFVAFAIGAAVAFLYWKLAMSGPVAARLSSFVLVLGGIGLFLYPLRFAPQEKMSQIFIGLTFAVIAISVVGSLLWMMKRFLDADTLEGEKAER